MSDDPPARIAVTFLTNAAKQVGADSGSNLLRVSLREKGGIPWKCGAGLCGTCRCRIVAGREHADAVKARERTHLTEADLAAGDRMACQTFIHGDVGVAWGPGDVSVASKHGDVSVASKHGDVSVASKHGDVSVARGPRDTDDAGAPP